MIPAFPKPGQVKKKPVAVRVLRDGREKVNLLCKEGRDEYTRRKRVMWERQKGICCLYGIIPGCPGKLALGDAMFEHELGRTAGHLDDRVEVNGRWINGSAHSVCNSKKGSRKIQYNDAP
jgi:hypothetical protein